MKYKTIYADPPWFERESLPNAYNVLKGCEEELKGGAGCTTY